MTTNDKYLLFRQIEPKLRHRALVLAGGDNFTAKEILAAAADLFASRYRDAEAGRGGAVMLARICLPEAARNLRLNSTRPSDAGGPAVSPPTPPSVPPLPRAWELWERLPRDAQVGAIAEVIRQVLAGLDLADAGAAVGWTPVQTTRELARLGARITGNRPARYTSRRPVLLPLPDAA